MAIGIVAEYNPFHNGHIRQINWIKQNFPNEKIIVIMSDKFSQRGEYTITSFNNRKKIAKKYGINKVLKLTFKETVQAAHIFAHNAIEKLYRAGVNKIVFGSETNNPDRMIRVAKFLKNNIDEFNHVIRHYIKKEKLAYPKAFASALIELTGENFDMPNDILGFEYVKSIVNNNYNIEIFTIERNIPFHSQLTNQNFASASLLRTKLKNNEDISNYSPMKISHPRFIEKDYKKFINILTKTPINKLRKIKLISEGIENLLLKNSHLKTYDEFVDACVSKRYTSSRIKRIIAWILCKKWK
ncbi:nucleotidyltransferase [Mycoplasma zalophidermidis]|uniref:Nucleotidyltransferase n=1 Tax=Mycoplasma zalophidermidis TaxID=398174 RepID=A0ABS6DS69_9MOLU|nr:nucleotidyltransferase [Mycoplasma zalophidermidis]MBU4690010.1 nucleotidyltransferase [Mycoplasma zalophidermidis]MBU4693836.1 nucleotidyltransferase [Mycoplasma zalophidermidis]MCR8966857.1 nucleotidyltransferase [Mycoplasma zalophidermidis]